MHVLIKCEVPLLGLAILPASITSHKRQQLLVLQIAWGTLTCVLLLLLPLLLLPHPSCHVLQIT
jgi:hypothetical protein